MNASSLLHRYQELIALSKQYLQESSESSLITNDTAHQHFSRFATKKAAPLPPPAPIKAPIQIKPVEKKIEPPPTVKIEPPPAPVKPTPASFPFLPRGKEKTSPRGTTPHFDDIKELLKKLAPQLAIHDTIPTDEAAIKKADSWKSSYPKIVILSFFASDSREALFLKTVSEAVTGRLAPCAVLHSPAKEKLTELIVLTEALPLKAIIVAANNDTLAKANDFLAHTPLQPHNANFQLLTSRGAIHATPLFNLIVNDTLPADAEKKGILWKELREILS
jgi:hypothetical protein